VQHTVKPLLGRRGDRVGVTEVADDQLGFGGDRCPVAALEAVEHNNLVAALE